MFRSFLVSALLLAQYTMGLAQCTGTLGKAIISETFGSGTSTIGPALPAGQTNMEYVQTTCPNDGQYCIVNATANCFGGTWYTLTDHTGDPGGYFMLINASYQPSQFFAQTVNGLCSGTAYNFSAWVVNADNFSTAILPNLTFTVEKPDGTVIKSYSTGNIPVASQATWSRYGFSFVTPAGVSSVLLTISNNAPGGDGNDLGLDDITFAPTGPDMTVSVQGMTSDTVKNSCRGTTTLQAKIGACYPNPAYQWQVSADNINFSNINGATGPSYQVGLPPAGKYFFRFNVAGAAGLVATDCSIYSNVIEVIAVQYPPPKYQSLSAYTCSGAPYVMPSGKIANATGVYQDTVYNQGGCDSLITSLNLTVGGKPDLGSLKYMCMGDSLTLSPGVFAKYLWQDGSTAPTYTVKTAGVYWVKTVDANNCMAADSVTVMVINCSKPPPNTFTPNGDGINDKWQIDILKIYPNCTVAVFDRWGRQVFRSVGYANPWDGTCNGKALPVGTYYYIIDFKNNMPPMSGFVTIIR